MQKNFHNLCDDFLANLAEQLESKDQSTKLDVEYSDGILKITLEDSGKTYIINRHSASEKIWYSSPFSGANYFSFNEKWLNSKGEELSQKLFLELKNYL